MANVWEVKNNTATYKENGTTVAVITGLRTGLQAVSDENGDSIIDGIEYSSGEITLHRRVLTNTAVSVTKGEVTLAVDKDCEEQEQTTWSLSGDTAELYDGTSTSYEATEDGKKINFVDARPGNTVLAKITGLRNPSLDDDGNISGIDINGKTLTVEKRAIINGSLTLTGDGYTFELGDELLPQPVADEDPKWEVPSKGTATLTTTMSGGFQLSADNKTISTLAGGETTVMVKGLSNNVKASDLNGEGEVKGAFSLDGNVITVHNTSVLGTGNAVVSSDLGTFTFEFADDAEGDVATVTGPAWDKTAKGTSATYQMKVELPEGIKSAYYANGSTISKITRTTTEKLATLSGIKNDLTGSDLDGENDYLAVNGTVITVKKALLESGTDKLYKDENGEQVTGMKKLSLDAKGKYTFALDSGAQVPKDDEAGAAWNFAHKTKNGKTAGTGTMTLDLTTSDGWAVDTSAKGASKSINYVASKKTNYATISGLTTELVVGDEEPDFENSKFQLEKDDEGAYTGNILYLGGDSESDADASEEPVYALKVSTGTDSSGGVVVTATLNESILGGKKISIKDNRKNTGKSYALALDDDYSVKDIETPKWSITSAGKATLVGGKTEGYKLNAAGTAIEYTAAKPTTYATITIKGMGAYLNGKKTELDGDQIAELEAELNAATTVATDSENGVIKLDASVLDGENIQSFALASKDKYKFELVTGTDDEDKDVALYGIEDDATPEWTVTPKSAKESDATKPKGTATYSASMTDGYELSSDGKTVTYKDAPENGAVLFTISGLNKELTVGELNNKLTDDDNPAIEVKDGEVIINDDSILDGKKVSLAKGTTYKLNINNILNKELEAAQWSIDPKKGTASYSTGTSGGYVFDKNSEISASYKAAAPANPPIAAISGLKKDASASSISIVPGAEGEKDTIRLTAGALTTTKATLTTGGDKYKIALFGVGASRQENGKWAISKGTATYTCDITEGWSTDGTSVTYTAGVANQKVMTISGLNKEVTELEDGDIVFDESFGTVTISNRMVGTSNITVKPASKTDSYTIVAGTGIPNKAEEKTEWVNSKGTATYKTYTAGYFSGSGQASTLTYTKEGKANTLATIKGLNSTISGSAIDDHIHIDEDTNVITIDDAALVQEPTAKTAVSLATVKGGTAYTLALGEEQEVEYADPIFGKVASKKSLLTASVEKAGYTIDSTGTKLTYVPEKITKNREEFDNSVTLATVSNVVDEKALSLEKDEETDEYTGYILVSEDALGDSNITLGKNDNYKFKLMKDGESVTSLMNGDITEGTDTIKSGTYTLKGTTPNSYTLKDDKTIAVTKGNSKTDGVTLVTIKGLNTEASVSHEDKVFSLSDSDIATPQKGAKTVTVDSAYGYSFEFVGDFSGAEDAIASVAGGKNTDNIKVEGEYLFVNAGAGDDVIDLGTKGNNTFAYKVGDGNDVIANFTAASDKIQLITADAKVTVTSDSGNAVVSITDKKGTEKTAGSITLTGVAASGLNILDSKGNKIDYTVSSADLASSGDLIYDINYGTSANLSDIVDSPVNISVADLDTNKDYTNIAPQTVVYGVKK